MISWDLNSILKLDCIKKNWKDSRQKDKKGQKCIKKKRQKDKN